MAECPLCGAEMPRDKNATITTVDMLVEIMRRPTGKTIKHKDGLKTARYSCYETQTTHQDCLYSITYIGGAVPESIVKEALAKGLIGPEWPDHPEVNSYVAVYPPPR
jgi:hypothetical protein